MTISYLIIFNSLLPAEGGELVAQQRGTITIDQATVLPLTTAVAAVCFA